MSEPEAKAPSSASPLVVVIILAVIGAAIYASLPGGEQRASEADLSALIEQGDALLPEGVDEALPYYQKAYALDPSSALASAALGRALEKGGRFDEALPYLEGAYAAGARDFTTLLSLGVCRTSAERHQDARPLLEAARLLQPDDPMPLYYLGVGAFRLNEWQRAVDYFTPYLVLRPRNLAAQHMNVEALDQLGRRQDAVAALGSLSTLTPQDMALRLRLQAGRVEVDGYEATLAAAAKRAEGEQAPLRELFFYARLLARHPDRAAETRAVLERALARDADMAPALVALAQEDQRDGLVDDARDRLQRVLSLEPKASEAKALLADTERQAGRFDEARAVFEGLLGGNYTPRANMGIVALLLDQEKDEEALAFVEGLFAEAAPSDPRKWVIGRTLQAVGRYDDARAILDALLEQGRPEDAVIWRGHLTYLQLESADLAGARQTFDTILGGLSAGVRVPADVRLWAGVARWEQERAAAEEQWRLGAEQGIDLDGQALYTRACRRLSGSCQRAELLAAARVAGWTKRNDALFVEGLAQELAGDAGAARTAYGEGLQATRGDEFPGRLIRRALQRLGDE